MRVALGLSPRKSQEFRAQDELTVVLPDDVSYGSLHVPCSAMQALYASTDLLTPASAASLPACDAPHIYSASGLPSISDCGSTHETTSTSAPLARIETDSHGAVSPVKTTLQAELLTLYANESSHGSTCTASAGAKSSL